MTTETNNLGAFIAARRRARGMTQSHVAGCCGKGRSWLSMLEAGRITGLPDPRTVEVLADLLLISPADLLIAAGYSLRTTINVALEAAPDTDEIGAVLRTLVEDDFGVLDQSSWVPPGRT